MMRELLRKGKVKEKAKEFVARKGILYAKGTGF